SSTSLSSLGSDSSSASLSIPDSDASSLPSSESDIPSSFSSVSPSASSSTSSTENSTRIACSSTSSVTLANRPLYSSSENNSFIPVIVKSLPSNFPLNGSSSVPIGSHSTSLDKSISAANL